MQYGVTRDAREQTKVQQTDETVGDDTVADPPEQHDSAAESAR
jgi:hypothetical protein